MNSNLSIYGKFKLCICSHCRIYEKQAKGEAFSSPLRMLSALSPTFESMLTTSFGKWLDLRLKLSKNFCEEVVYGFVANCFCADLTVHAFAGEHIFIYSFSKVWFLATKVIFNLPTAVEAREDLLFIKNI